MFVLMNCRQMQRVSVWMQVVPRGGRGAFAVMEQAFARIDPLLCSLPFFPSFLSFPPSLVFTRSLFPPLPPDNGLARTLFCLSSLSSPPPDSFAVLLLTLSTTPVVLSSCRPARLALSFFAFANHTCPAAFYLLCLA